MDQGEKKRPGENEYMERDNNRTSDKNNGKRRGMDNINIKGLSRRQSKRSRGGNGN